MNAGQAGCVLGCLCGLALAAYGALELVTTGGYRHGLTIAIGGAAALLYAYAYRQEGHRG